MACKRVALKMNRARIHLAHWDPPSYRNCCIPSCSSCIECLLYGFVFLLRCRGNHSMNAMCWYTPMVSFLHAWNNCSSVHCGLTLAISRAQKLAEHIPQRTEYIFRATVMCVLVACFQFYRCTWQVRFIFINFTQFLGNTLAYGELFAERFWVRGWNSASGWIGNTWIMCADFVTFFPLRCVLTYFVPNYAWRWQWRLLRRSDVIQICNYFTHAWQVNGGRRGQRSSALKNVRLYFCRNAWM